MDTCIIFCAAEFDCLARPIRETDCVIAADGGLRHYLKRIPKEEIQRLTKTDPDYFFNMAPYALSLGIIHPFASNFGSKKLEQCPYLMTRVHGKRTAAEWAELMAQAADMMDARYRRMEIEKWTAVQVRTVSRPRR